MSSILVVTDPDEIRGRQWYHRAVFFERLTNAGWDTDEYVAHADRWWPATRDQEAPRG